MAEDFLDDRFRTLLTDPKFKKPRKHDRKIKIDKRFQSMFKNDSFKVKYTVDKRGRPISKSTSEDFKKFYDLPSDEDEKSTASEESQSEETESEEASVSGEKQKKLDKSSFPNLQEDEKDKTLITRNIREKLMDMDVDYARGEGKLFSDSSSDESESEESEDEDLYHEWNELDKDAEVTYESSNRLAICNMDWDRIRAVDLMMLLNSFLPTGTLVDSVVIYPSEYGMKRMQEEEVNGPPELVNTSNTNCDSDSDENDGEGKNFHRERMRKYQLNRLRYFYAIATFDTPETADYVYTNCNGVEYESSGIRLDLRVVDDDTTFDQQPKDVCKSTDNYAKYQPRFFTNTALQQVKVELTWDETDPRRLEFTQKINEAAKNGEINDSDLEDFVALSSSGEEDEQESENEERTFEAVMSDNESQSNSENSDEESDPIMTYRKLLKEIEENEKADRESEEELEITWGTGDAKKTVTKTRESSDNKSNDKLTPFERLIEKKIEKSKLKKIKSKKQDDDDAGDDIDSDKESKKSKKKKKKKEITEVDEQQKHELELLLMDENNDNKHHFSLKKIQENESTKKKKKLRRKKKTKEALNDDFQVDVNDDRFTAIYSSHLFNIDPTNSKFTKTKAMEAFIKEKQKRISQNDNSVKDSSDEPATKIQKTSGHISSELSSLVQSVKNKSKMMLPKKHVKIK